jgi:hypothetical protein
LAFVIPFTTCLAMAAGAIFFWLAKVSFKNEKSIWNRTFVKCLEPVCAGVIAGGALMGITLMVFQYVIMPMFRG